MVQVPTNRQVIDTLRTLPDDQPFGYVKEDDRKTREFLESLYTSLKPLFGKASCSSKANLKQIQGIQTLKISHQDHFSQYIQSPSVFWEIDIKVLRYFNDENRAKAFLDSAYQLKQSVDDLLVLRRFVELAAYHLYHRAFPDALNVTIRNVEDFLVHSQVVERVCQNEHDAAERASIIQEYSEMIKRGHREHNFCVDMVKVTEVNGNNTVMDNSIYGPLFIESIPEIFTPKGLLGTDYDKSVKHLKKLWTGQAAVEAGKLAKIVLDYHGKHILWPSAIGADMGKKKRHRTNDSGARQRKKHRATAAEKPCFEGAPAHNVSDQVLSDSTAAQILNQMTRNVRDDGHGFVSDTTAHIIDPIARQVESNSGPSHIQNAENPSSARLSASSTEVDSTLFVYQNDSSVIIDKSTPVQQPQARSCHHDQSESRSHVMGNGPFQSAPASNDNVTDLSEVGVSSDDLLEANTDTVNDTTQQSTSVQTHLGAFESDQECHPDYNTHFKFDTFNFLDLDYTQFNLDTFNFLDHDYTQFNLDTFNFLDHDYTQFNLDTFNFLDHDYTQFSLDTFTFQDDDSTQLQTPIASYL